MNSSVLLPVAVAGLIISGPLGVRGAWLAWSQDGPAEKRRLEVRGHAFAAAASFAYPLGAALSPIHMASFSLGAIAFIALLLLSQRELRRALAVGGGPGVVPSFTPRQASRFALLGLVLFLLPLAFFHLAR